MGHLKAEDFALYFFVYGYFRNLKTLFLEESQVTEKDGEWLHELALNNTMLETLNFYMTDLSKVSFKDLELIATKCKSLVSVKIGDCEILDLVGFFRAAVSLQEFGGGCFNDQARGYGDLTYPPKLCRLGLNYMSTYELPIVFPLASRLKKLDLLYCLLDTEDHCLLLQRCPNLEVLEVDSFRVCFCDVKWDSFRLRNRDNVCNFRLCLIN